VSFLMPLFCLAGSFLLLRYNYMLTKKQKELLIKEFAENVANSKVLVVCDFKGMTVAEIGELRGILKESGVRMQVLKKTLAQIALDNLEIDLDIRRLEGQLAFVYGGDDEVSAAKLLNKFAKNNEKLKMLVGALEGKAMEQEDVVALAKLPSKEELLAKVVGSLKAPVSGLVNVLGGNLRGLINVLTAIKDSKG